MMDLYLHMGMALVLVSGLIFLLGRFFKKRQEKESLMKIMGYQSLGPKKGIAMVKVGPEVLLVGVTATDIKLLKTMDAVVEERETEAPHHPQAMQKVITADASEKLQKLRALKGALKDSLYAIK